MPQTPDSLARSARHVFVYGTLRRGGANDINRLAPAPAFVGTAQIEGVMHHLGAYPGVRLQAGGTVQGEVYAIAPEVERLLDEIEMILPEPTGEYLKRELAVQVGPRQLACLVYEISPAHADGKPVIASGDWIANKDG
ncbi:gamma-glutamylcyclotransferase [Rhodoferax koreense]|uniref:Gamma-glutamylcyclotransferase n=1 Tax=Rhodoferax koreensis TaxID=1842727 RepID=A0A1P8JTY0_9BURK|nr:gamma-glutamylcyclotransferase family protein [Rhodoferax koreense]APW37226.1 gamma-glutamylcyclotransferase [Rhodoferax koreense]